MKIVTYAVVCNSLTFKSNKKNVLQTMIKIVLQHALRRKLNLAFMPRS